MPTITPDIINFGNFYTQAQFQIYNSGTGDLIINNFASEDPNLIITAPESSDGLGIYSIQLNRENLDENSYSSIITFSTNSELAPTLEVNVNYEVRNNIDKPNAGTLWVNFYEVFEKQSNWIHLIIDENGFYDFSNSQLSAGVYQILAGTDPDNDGRIGNITEGLGYYPSQVDPVPLILNENITGVDFNINYQIPVSETNNLNETNSNKDIKKCDISKNKDNFYFNYKCEK